MHIVPQLLTLLKGENRFARYGALQCLTSVGRHNQEATEICLDIIENSDDWTARHFAVKAFIPPHTGGSHTPDEEKARWLGPLDTVYVKRIMKEIAKPYPEAGYQAKKHKGDLNALLFGDRGLWPLKNGNGDLSNMDREYLVPMMHELLLNPHGGVRSGAAKVLPHLTKEEMKPLWGLLYHAMTHKAPSGKMFGQGLNAYGNETMAKHHIKEGLPLAITFVFEDEGWGNMGRKRSLAGLTEYGGYITEHLKELSQRDLNRKSVKAVVKEFEGAPKPELVSIETYIKEYEAKLAAEEQ